MDTVKKLIFGPDPREQYRKCQSTIRRNKRQMDRQIQDLQKLEKKTKSLIKQAAKKGDLKSAKLYAREYRNVGKTQQRMYLSRATLDSISMKLEEQQQLIKIKGSMQKSTAIMKDMNTLVRLPEMSRTVQEMTKELTKSGVIDEMVDDIIDENGWQEEDEDEEEQITQILDEVLHEEGSTVSNMPEAKVAVEESGEKEEEEEETENDEMLANMRQRLSALQE
ncbi:DEKNAAC105234 [Brettanomyces naardenensis]|uniref:DEKNAAC105234 n=1 Tax=Brettanomyces naardenensis TaxID=13370 RepID=A0A448YSY5_BRENA|nr:DEKNAAC105234 [Brettanomyces naardenensis]